MIADFTRLKQVLLVLLSNAVKYNSDGGMITLDGVVTGDGRLRISVADTGPGIAADQRAVLFRPFSQLSHSRDGAGVGLALAKHLIELMGGDIGFDSADGAGSTFWIEAPLAEPVATTPADPTQGAPVPVDQRILYVEDNPANRQLMERVVALSAKAMPRDIEAGLAAGFDGYVTKPVRIDQLLGTIDTVLARRAADARAPTLS